MAETQGHIIITLENDEKTYEYDALGVTFESTDEEILDAISPSILEEFGVNIREDNLFVVKKVESSKNIFLFPKSPAGMI